MLVVCCEVAEVVGVERFALTAALIRVIHYKDARIGLSMELVGATNALDLSAVVVEEFAEAMDEV